MNVPASNSNIIRFEDTLTKEAGIIQTGDSKAEFKEHLTQVLAQRLPTTTTLSEAKQEKSTAKIDKKNLLQKAADTLLKGLKSIGLVVGVGIGVTASVMMLPIALPGAAIGSVAGKVKDKLIEKEREKDPNLRGTTFTSKIPLYTGLGGIASVAPLGLALLAINELIKE